MNDLLTAIPSVNGGPPVVNGRGLLHLKLTDEELVRLAADLATGQRPFQPSVAQTTLLTGVSATKIRAEIKARVAQAENQEADEIQWVVESWECFSKEARQEVFRRIGPAEVWDALSSIVV
jgi:hypothetical protein